MSKNIRKVKNKTRGIKRLEKQGNSIESECFILIDIFTMEGLAPVLAPAEAWWPLATKWGPFESPGW